MAKPGARIISIGRKVEDFLNKKKLARHLGGIPHYALTANKHWGKSIKGREEAYRKFCAEVEREYIERVAEEVLEEGGVGEALKEEKLKRLRKGSGLTESRKKLVFDYKVDFERMRGGVVLRRRELSGGIHCGLPCGVFRWLKPRGGTLPGVVGG